MHRTLLAESNNLALLGMALFPRLGNLAARLLHPTPEPEQESAQSPAPVSQGGGELLHMPEPAVAGSSPAASESALDVYHAEPAAASIVAEVSSLQGGARTGLEQSFRGLHVRWRLRLAAISEFEEANGLHSVRMYPDGRSPQYCGIYMGLKLEEYPEVRDPKAHELFQLEATIDKVEDNDIDLRDVKTIRKLG
jgi:hypothetical protein